MCVADSLCCTTETNPAEYSSYIPIKIFKNRIVKKKKNRIVRISRILGVITLGIEDLMDCA